MKSKHEHWGRCRIASEVVYGVCKLLRLKGNYKINIIHYIRSSQFQPRGHAWVTCDDKDLFLTPAHRREKMRVIGESDKYRYWISAK